MDASAVVSKNPDVVTRDLADSEGAVLLNVETGAYHGLNSTALVTWALIDGTRTVSQLVDAVRNEFADAPETLDADVVRFVEGALERDLVRASQHGARGDRPARDN